MPGLPSGAGSRSPGRGRGVGGSWAWSQSRSRSLFQAPRARPRAARVEDRWVSAASPSVLGVVVLCCVTWDLPPWSCARKFPEHELRGSARALTGWPHS